MLGESQKGSPIETCGPGRDQLRGTPENQLLVCMRERRAGEEKRISDTRAARGWT